MDPILRKLFCSDSRNETTNYQTGHSQMRNRRHRSFWTTTMIRSEPNDHLTNKYWCLVDNNAGLLFIQVLKYKNFFILFKIFKDSV